MAPWFVSIFYRSQHTKGLLYKKSNIYCFSIYSISYFFFSIISIPLSKPSGTGGNKIMMNIAEVKNICRRQSYLETVIWEHLGETELEWLAPCKKSPLDTASFAESFMDHPFLQIMMMNTYWFLINYEFDTVQSIPNYSSTLEQTEEIEQILLFLYQNVSAYYYNRKAIAY